MNKKLKFILTTKVFPLAIIACAVIMAIVVHPLMAFVVLFAGSPMKQTLGMADVVGGAGTDTASEMLKTFYLDGYNSQLNNTRPWWQRLQNAEKKVVGGSSISMFTITERHSGVGARGERQPTPIPGSVSGINPTSSTKQVFLSLGITQKMLNAAKAGDMASFRDPLEVQLNEANDTGALVLDTMFHGDTTGILARVAGGPSAGVITVDNDGLVNSTTNARLRWLYVGMYLASVNSSTGEITQNGMLVTAISGNTVTVTVNGVATSGSCADNDYLVRGSQSGEGSDYNNGLEGLSAALATSNNTYWGINRANVGLWRPQRYNASGVTVDETLWRAPIDLLKINGASMLNQAVNTEVPEDMAILTSVEGATLFASKLIPNKRYVNSGEPVKLYGGWSAILCHGLPMVEDPAAPLGMYYYVRWADWKVYSELGQIGFSVFDTDGQTIRKIPGYTSFEILLQAQLQLGCLVPNKQAVLYNVSGMTAAVSA